VAASIHEEMHGVTPHPAQHLGADSITQLAAAVQQHTAPGGCGCCLLVHAPAAVELLVVRELLLQQVDQHRLTVATRIKCGALARGVLQAVQQRSSMNRSESGAWKASSILSRATNQVEQTCE
jgi:hypothetical protein